MTETFKQGMYIYVGGILFCIAAAILMILNSSIMDLGERTDRGSEVVYDINETYHIDKPSVDLYPFSR